MTKLLLIAAALLSAASTPVLAKEGRTAATAITQSDAPRAQVAPVSSKQRYCVRETEPNSPFVYRTCKTREQWLKDGFDPLAKQ